MPKRPNRETPKAIQIANRGTLVINVRGDAQVRIAIVPSRGGQRRKK